MAKRLFDITFATISLIVLSPIMLLIALGIRLTSSGPAIYRGIRVGKNGRSFRMLKFRTMIIDAEALGGYCVGENDLRITAFGKFLRKYKLDEFPQLLNVLRGEMSLVGPRPEVQKYVDMYTNEEKVILTACPGITDWATLWDSDEGAILSGSPDPERTYLDLIRPEKLRLQLKYVREKSFLVDLKIIFRTLVLVLARCCGGKQSEGREIPFSLGKQP